MFIVILAAALAAPNNSREADLSFSKRQVFDARLDMVAIGRIEGTRDPAHYWLRRTVRYRSDLRLRDKPSIWWTDTKRCPAAGWVITEAIKLPMPTIFVPGQETMDTIAVRADGATYELLGSARYYPEAERDMRLEAGADTPLANWIDESLRKLDACWSKEQPQGL